MKTTAIAIAFTALAACASSGPKPLSHRLDDKNLASVPTTERTAAVDAQRQWYLARIEVDHARYQLNQIDSELEVAKNEKAKADLEKKSAKEMTKSSERTAEKQKMDAAATSTKRAESMQGSAKARVAYLKARKKYLAKNHAWSIEAMYAAEARFEQAKASIARKRGLRPKGFKADRFTRQAEQRQKRSAKARQKAEAARKSAEAKLPKKAAAR